MVALLCEWCCIAHCTTHHTASHTPRISPLFPHTHHNPNSPPPTPHSAELTFSYVYTSMSNYFNRDMVALIGFAKFFHESSQEERYHAQILMDEQVWRWVEMCSCTIKHHTYVVDVHINPSHSPPTLLPTLYFPPPFPPSPPPTSPPPLTSGPSWWSCAPAHHSSTLSAGFRSPGKGRCTVGNGAVIGYGKIEFH